MGSLQFETRLVPLGHAVFLEARFIAALSTISGVNTSRREYTGTHFLGGLMAPRNPS